MNVYWGDIHNHCEISYGYGCLENALSLARGHLDFCSITGHASWPDMPEPIGPLKELVDYHKKGFEKLRENWNTVVSALEAASIPHQFVTFHSCEMHSRKYGDYHFLSPSKFPIVEVESPFDVLKELAPLPVVAIPHHVAYPPGFRGVNWHFFNSEVSPVVEVYSKHGCGISDGSPYPYFHDMGPRDSRSSVREGLGLGYQFGFLASTDHHAGYPGSYGDGLAAVWASEKTREAIWEAILSRRTYAVTGDRIICRFQVNGVDMGGEVEDGGCREIKLWVIACDFFDKLIIYKNSLPWLVLCGEKIFSKRAEGKFKVRLEMGWGNSQDFLWEGSILVEDASVVGVEPCFRGRNVLSPQDLVNKNSFEANALPNRIIYKDKKEVRWKCVTFKNYSTLHPLTSAIVLEMEGDEKSVLKASLNGKKVEVSIKDLRKGSLGFYLRGFNSEAFLFHRVVPSTHYKFCGEWIDREAWTSCDFYDVEIRQANGQCAWISPIFVRA